MLSFLWPWVLALAPLPIVYRWLRAEKPLQVAALRAPMLVAAAESQPTMARSQWRNLLIFLLLWLCWLSTLAALGRPVWVGEPVALPTSGRDILLAVDISGSMERDDMQIGGRQVNRLVAVKSVVGDFVIKRDGDRLGLILFGEKAYLQTPLTFDRQTMQTLLNEAQIGFAGQGTAIGDAIGVAIKRLQERPENHRVLILLTDGANNAGQLDPLKAASLAARARVKIYTIGIGAESQEVWGLFGRQISNPAADLDEETLVEIAAATGGNYFRARNPAELTAIYQRLNELEPIEQSSETIRPIAALFYWPLGAAFLLALCLALISSRRRLYV
jgi:Ca-activated chloride channel family protein|tara:strand:+ start:7530 stop:8522 length:993 start_codon:yes stop_codon:yes gene_type:complete